MNKTTDSTSSSTPLSPSLTVKTKVSDTTKAPQADTKLTDLKLEIKEVGKAEFDAPITEVYLIANGQKNLLTKENMLVSETPIELYKDYEIPSNALISCRGWWAGGGNDYWVLQGNGELEVYERWIEEGSGPDQPAQVGKPKLIKKIKM